MCYNYCFVSATQQLEIIMYTCIHYYCSVGNSKSIILYIHCSVDNSKSTIIVLYCGPTIAGFGRPERTGDGVHSRSPGGLQSQSGYGQLWRETVWLRGVQFPATATSTAEWRTLSHRSLQQPQLCHWEWSELVNIHVHYTLRTALVVGY